VEATGVLERAGRCKSQSGLMEEAMAVNMNRLTAVVVTGMHSVCHLIEILVVAIKYY